MRDAANPNPHRNLGWFIPCYIPVRVRIGETEHLLAGFPIPKTDKTDSTELFAGLLRDGDNKVMLIWQEHFIGYAGVHPNGQAWTQAIGKAEQIVPDLRQGCHDLLRAYIAGRLTQLDQELDDWQRDEAQNGRR